MRTDPGSDFTTPAAALLPLATAMALVGIRGEIAPAVTALVLALTVVAGGRMGGRGGGVVASLMAATSFDFFHTEPYLTLKIADTTDIVATILLLLVGLAVGGGVNRADRERRRARLQRAEAIGLTRVLAAAAEGSADKVERSVRAELTVMLDLEDCWFTTETLLAKSLEPSGAIRVGQSVSLAGSCPLPEAGVSVPVTWNGRCFGSFVAFPRPGTIVSTESRQTAVAMAQVLGLALAAEPARA